MESQHRRWLKIGAVATALSLPVGVLAVAPATAAEVPIGEVFVSDLPWKNESNGYGPIERDRSNGEAGASDGRTITIAGTEYTKGIGMHATGGLDVALDRNCTTFTSLVGVDDEVGTNPDPTGPALGSIVFQVWGDRVLLTESAVMSSGQEAFPLTADVTGVQTLRLVADESTNGKNYDHGDWAQARLECADDAPEEPGEAEAWELEGPGGVQARVALDEVGTLDLRVDRDGETVVSADDLGLRTDEGDFRTGLRYVDHETTTVTDEYTMTTGKAQERAYEHTETTFTFATGSGEELTFVVRVADDGVAYRYALGEGAHRVTDEAGAWVFEEDGHAWMQTDYYDNYEAEWRETTVGAGTNSEGEASSLVGYPILAEAGDSTVLLTESDLHGNYSGSHLAHEAGTLAYEIDLFEGQAVSWDGDAPTPWRVAIVSDLAGVVESNLVDDLATVSQLEDTSWVKPGTSSWSWLTDWDSPRSEERQRDFVDLAARNGWEYVLLDEGWQEAWVPRTVRYAQSQGVDVIVWFHSRDLLTQEQRDEWLPRLKSWGVSGLKVDFMDTDSQAIHQWYEAISRDTAANQLMINFHGSALPTGLQRTWPHIMSYEAIRGAENGIEPQRSLMAPFARNVVGSMDWTPVTLSRGNGNSSVAHEVAMSIVYESGWQHFSDNPESYAAHPNVERLLQNIPAGTWSDTRLISGDPASNIVLARQQGDRWFVGGMQAGSGAPMTLPLSELGGGEWIVDLLADGASNSETTLTTERHAASDVLSIPVRENGGFAAIVCPAEREQTTCLENPETVPDATMTVDPGEVQLRAGDAAPLQVSFTPAEEATAVELTAELPEGWTDAGIDTARAETLAGGEALTADWSIEVPAGAEPGVVEIPVTATFRSAGDEYQRFDEVTVTVPPPPLGAGAHYISDLVWTDESNGYGPIERDQSNGQAAAGDGRPLEIDGATWAKGVGMHATGGLTTWLGGGCTTFTSIVGIDDEVLENPDLSGTGSVRFAVYGDGRLLAETDELTNDDDAFELTVDITGVDALRLVANEGDGKNFDHADWADAQVVCEGVEEPEQPVITVTTDPAAPDGANGWFISPVEVTLDAEGDDAIEYRLGEGEWTSYEGPFTLEEDGVWSIQTRFAAESGGGVVASQEVAAAADDATVIRLDRSAAMIVVDGVRAGSTITADTRGMIRWSANDPHSDVAEVTATLDGLLQSGTQLDTSALGVGEHRLVVSAVNGAGLVSESTVIVFTVSSTGQLAVTGATFGGLLAAGMLLAALGAVLMLQRRRRLSA